jgi:hypothetical protein
VVQTRQGRRNDEVKDKPIMPLTTYRASLLAELNVQQPEVEWNIGLVRRNDGGVRFYIARGNDSRRPSGRYATVAYEELETVPIVDLARRVIADLDGGPGG